MTDERMTMDESKNQGAVMAAMLRTQYSVLSTQYLLLALIVSGLVPLWSRPAVLASDKAADSDKPTRAALTAEAETPSSAADDLDLDSAKDSIIIPPGRPAWTEE